MRVSKALVIETASQIADEQGLNSLSLKAVAEKLNVRTPSLYNHIESLDDLLREVVLVTGTPLSYCSKLACVSVNFAV